MSLNKSAFGNFLASLGSNAERKNGNWASLWRGQRSEPSSALPLGPPGSYPRGIGRQRRLNALASIQIAIALLRLWTHVAPSPKPIRL